MHCPSPLMDCSIWKMVRKDYFGGNYSLKRDLIVEMDGRT